MKRIGRVIYVYVSLTIAVLASFFGSAPRFGPGFTWVLPATLIALLAGLLVYINLPGWVDVGADGLFIDWRDERSFIPFDDIAASAIYRVRSGGKRFVGVDLELVDGGVVRVPIGEDQFGASARAEALQSALAAALAAFRERKRAAHPPLPMRGDRSVQEWLTSLRAVGTGANAGPRVAPIPPEQLWTIVEDPAARPQDRAAAAAALGARLDDRQKHRLRVAAADSASPRLRVAHEMAAREDVRALGEILDEMAEADAMRSRR